MIPISQLVVIIKNGTPFTMFDRETLFYIMEYQFVLVLSECNIKKFFGALNEEGQGKLLGYADDLVTSGKYKKNSESRMGKTELA